MLVIDDWGLAPLTSPERHDLLEVLEDRTERAATLITSLVPVKAWHELIGEPTIADSICDRLVHTAYIIELRAATLISPRARRDRLARRSSTGDNRATSLRSDERSRSAERVITIDRTSTTPARHRTCGRRGRMTRGSNA